MPRPTLALAVVLTALAIPSIASADDHTDDRAAAQELFQQGKELMRVGNFAAACPKFEAAAQFTSTVGVRLNLANCLAKIGKTASAWSTFDEALGLAERAGDTVAADIARKGRADLEPQLVLLTIVVGPDEAAVPGLELKRDGVKLPQGAWNSPIPVDPGPHLITAEAPGRKAWTSTPGLEGAGTRATVTVPMLGLAGSDSANEPSGAGGGGTRRTLAFVTAGVGVVGLGLGTYFAVDALGDKSDYKKGLNSAGTACATSACQTESHDAYAAGNVATAMFVAGGVLVAAGATLYFTAPSSHASGPTARVFPLVGPGSAGVGVVSDW